MECRKLLFYRHDKRHQYYLKCYIGYIRDVANSVRIYNKVQETVLAWYCTISVCLYVEESFHVHLRKLAMVLTLIKYI